MSHSRPLVDLSTYLIDPPPPIHEAWIDWAELFSNRNPVELEIGSGKGLFLTNAASATPRHNFLGVELSRKYAQLAAIRLARRQLPNARLWHGDAAFVLGRLVPRASLRAVHAYFPDPWWKRRHKKRRVFTAALVSDIERALEPEGALRVASDVAEYFELIRSLIEAKPRFCKQPIALPKDAEHVLDYLSNFERKYRLEGRPIYRADYVLEMGQGAGE
jgi:tRNA (guanine-N7-)-methyltransferase